MIGGFSKPRRQWRVACTLTGLLCVLATGGLRGANDDPAGRYVIAKDLDQPATPRTGEPYAGTVDVKVRRGGVCTLNWRIRGDATPRRLQGLGLWDKRSGVGGPLLCASMNTGGAAYGLALYRRGEKGRWQGSWVTSVDDGAELGEMRIDTGSDTAALVGRHHLHGSRGRAGSFEGAVTIAAQGEFLELAYEVNGIPVYRGLGLLLPDPNNASVGERLVVAWSFGSVPALAIYSAQADGSLTGRRVSVRHGEPLIRNERLARSVPGTDPTTGQLLLPPPVTVEPETALPER